MINELIIEPHGGTYIAGPPGDIITAFLHQEDDELVVTLMDNTDIIAKFFDTASRTI